MVSNTEKKLWTNVKKRYKKGSKCIIGRAMTIWGAKVKNFNVVIAISLKLTIW